jgi:hypothetical protein
MLLHSFGESTAVQPGISRGLSLKSSDASKDFQALKTVARAGNPEID